MTAHFGSMQFVGRASAIAALVDCFTPGTMILTREGKRPVERLRPGDLLLTRDRGFQPLLWCGIRQAEDIGGAAAGAVLIRAGALGAGRPERDMIVSPGHRLLIRNPESLGDGIPAGDLLDECPEPEVLIEARMLAGRPGISRIAPQRLRLVHLLMERHEIVLANGCWSESLLLTRARLEAIQACRHSRPASLPAELGALSGDAVQMPARPCPMPRLASVPAGPADPVGWPSPPAHSRGGKCGREPGRAVGRDCGALSA
ncbi:MAG: Hint domain-containing protein [Roseovarius sp.]